MSKRPPVPPENQSPKGTGDVGCGVASAEYVTVKALPSVERFAGTACAPDELAEANRPKFANDWSSIGVAAQSESETVPV